MFFYSSHHLEWQPFLHLVIIVTTLETHKSIFCYNNNIMQNDNSTCKQDYPEQEHYEQPYKVIHRLPLLDNMGELSQTFRLFWIPQKSLLKSSYPKKFLPKSSYPQKSRNQKFLTPKNPSVIPVTWNPEYPTPSPPPQDFQLILKLLRYMYHKEDLKCHFMWCKLKDSFMLNINSFDVN